MKKVIVVCLCLAVVIAGCMGTKSSNSENNSLDSTGGDSATSNISGDEPRNSDASDGTNPSNPSNRSDQSDQSEKSGQSGRSDDENSEPDESEDAKQTTDDDKDVTATPRTIEFGGRERSYRFYSPPSLESGAPLVVVLHGALQTGRAMEKYTDFTALAREEGFAVVYPDGVNRRWNVADTKGQNRGVNDVDFISNLTETLASRHNLSDSFYATGFSNGGMMSYRLACELSDVEAIAPVGGTMTSRVADNCSSSPPVLIFHGKSDPIVPWNGSGTQSERTPGFELYSVPRTVDYWTERNRCTESEESEIDRRDDGTSVNRVIYSCSENPVVLYGIENGGHTWPGGPQFLPETIIGKATKDVNATQLIWNFFSESE